jgi:hypothetical protein
MENELRTSTNERVVVDEACDAPPLVEHQHTAAEVQQGCLVGSSNRIAQVKPLQRLLCWSGLAIKFTMFLFVMQTPWFWFSMSLHEPWDRIRMLQIFMMMNGVVDAAASVIVLMFVYRAACNLRNAGGEGLKFHPLAALACWFVPVVNLFVPFIVMYEIYRASGSQRFSMEWRTDRLSLTFCVWWACWLLIGAITPAMATRLDVITASEMSSNLVLCVTRALLFIFSARAFLKIISEINHRQMHKFPELRTAE